MSAARGADAAPPARRVRCPGCDTSTEWRGNPHRPFCSLVCRLIDLGQWLDERYRIEADPPASRDPDGR